MEFLKIGKQITALRKEKGCTQEELASFVGVSAQAVSKWENGGVPDVQLLPKIASFFEISIDTLFGRTVTDFSSLEQAIIQKLSSVPREERMQQAFELCYAMEHALFGKEVGYLGPIEKERNEHGEKEQIYSRICMEDGYTEMGLFNRLQYFLLVPDAKDKDAAFFDGIDYPSLFRDLADEDFFRTLVFLNKRRARNAFTPNLFVKELGMSFEKATEIIQALKKYGLLYTSYAEIDDEPTELFTFNATPAFPSLLIFAHELIDQPQRFNLHVSSRKRPYFK